MSESNLITLGDFVFSLNTIPYNELHKQTEYVWESQKPVGDVPMYQGLGKGETTLTLSGTLYHEITGSQTTFIVSNNGNRFTPSEGTGLTLEPLEMMAETNESFVLVSGRGFNLGFWVITSIEETSTVFFNDGTPKKITFKLTLKKASPQQSQQTATISNGNQFSNTA